jgi:hypothetical protein
MEETMFYTSGVDTHCPVVRWTMTWEDFEGNGSDPMKVVATSAWKGRGEPQKNSKDSSYPTEIRAEYRPNTCQVSYLYANPSVLMCLTRMQQSKTGFVWFSTGISSGCALVNTAMNFRWVTSSAWWKCNLVQVISYCVISGLSSGLCVRSLERSSWGVVADALWGKKKSDTP